MKILKISLLFFLIFQVYTVSASAVLLLDGGIKENQKKVFKSFNKIGKLNPSNETGGFLYAYESPFLSNFDFNLYFGNYTDNNNEKTIVRIESSKNDTRILKEILQQDILHKKYNKSYSTKSHFIYQFLNLISPGFAYMYSSYESPRRSGSKGLTGGLGFLALDFSLYYLSVRKFFFDGRNPWAMSTIKKHYYLLAATMGTFRLISAFSGYLYISGHNDIVNLGYKFSF